jgi:hypothetical protein
VVTISAKSIGSRKPLFADWSIPLTPEWGEGGELTLRQLIEHLVRVEVSAFNARREERRLDRVLSRADLDQGHANGRFAPEARTQAPAADADSAVGTALEAFEDGMYLVFIDDQEQHDLDQPVRLRPDSRVMFLRLTFLAGA